MKKNCKLCHKVLKKNEGTICLQCVKRMVKTQVDARLFQRKSGRFTDRKKRANKQACRQPVRND